MPSKRYTPIPLGQFPPFSFSGGPTDDLIAGAGWVDGLWIFRGQ